LVQCLIPADSIIGVTFHLVRGALAMPIRKIHWDFLFAALCLYFLDNRREKMAKRTGDNTVPLAVFLTHLCFR
jgi:hypothetical protein